MKLTIEHKKTKREIEGAFNICGSREDLENFANQIINQILRVSSFSFGWIKIHPEEQKSIVDTPAIGWAEGDEGEND